MILPSKGPLSASLLPVLPHSITDVTCRTRFVDSEFLLLEALHALLLLASSPLLAYPLLLELSTCTSLADLLSHENADVIIAVIEVLEEWTDEEVLDGEIEDEEDEDELVDGGDREERREAMRGLVSGLLECGVVESSVECLERFDEADETERGGVYHTLGSFLSISTFDESPTFG